jgi:hypothetical protein
MTYEEYDAIEGVRWSILKWMSQSPAHFEEALQGGGRETAPLRLGRGVHCAILEPETFSGRWVTWTGKRDARHKKYQAFLAEHAGKEVLSATESSHIVSVSAAVRRHEEARRWVTGASEQVVTWRDEDTGLKCKARIDLLCNVKPGGPYSTAGLWRQVELKSTEDADPRWFPTRAARLGYHAQMAFHQDGLIANGFRMDPEPLVILVETVPPFDVQVFGLVEPAVEAGRREYKRLLARVADCMVKNEWPGRAPTGIQPLDIPERYYLDPETGISGALDLSGLGE